MTDNQLQPDHGEEASQFIDSKEPKINNHLIHRTSKGLKGYISLIGKHPLLAIVTISYLVLICSTITIFLRRLAASPHISQSNTTEWYQHEMIYEINVPLFYDSDQDGVGDLQGIIEKLDYLQRHNIQSILLQASIFNISNDLFEVSARQYAKIKTTDLLYLDPHIDKKDDFRHFMETLAHENMHLIIDLPLSSISDHKHLSWYGSNAFPSIQIENPCVHHKHDFGCRYYQVYKQLPLDFSKQEIVDAAEFRLRYWLVDRNVDGIRVDLPLAFDHRKRTYSISFQTINRWKILVNEIGRTTKPRLLLFDIPMDLQNLLNHSSLNTEIIYPISPSQFIEKQKSAKFDLHHSNKTVQRFWQLGSSKGHFRLGIMHEVSQRIFLTIAMLLGGTPVVLYGDELGVNEKNDLWMPWSSNAPYGGFSSCLSKQCNETLSAYDADSLRMNVKNEEKNADDGEQSVFVFFRHLSRLRKDQSFQRGVLKTGYESTTDILWFTRQTPGHRGFLIVIHCDRFQNKAISISLQNLTNHQVPKQVYYEYPSSQPPWFSDDMEKFSIYPGSINIFWWSSKV